MAVCITPNNTEWYAMVRKTLSFGILLAVATACQSAGDDSFSVVSEVVSSPAGPDSGEPFLATADGHTYLSWLEAAPEGGHDFRFASYLGDGTWGPATTIASSERFFVNWADFPSITRANDGSLWAHWLERGAAGGYDYGVRVASSSDGGKSWSDPWTPHDDDSPTEHGFVSTVTADWGVGFTWLDGRRYVDGKDGTAATKEMTLRYRAVGADGTRGPEMLIDGRVCDCCQTASALTDVGPVVAYRNRTSDEIRDIYLARMVDGAWVDGAPVHDDGWEIGGCPVNGPAVVARGMDVAVAWFTAAGDVPHVKVAFSTDGGATFGSPATVDDGNPGGRVDLVMTDDGGVVVSWLERTGGEDAEVRLRRVAPDGTATGSASLTSSSAARASGFPRMTPLDDGSLLLAWTDVLGDSPRVRVTRLTVD